MRRIVFFAIAAVVAIAVSAQPAAEIRKSHVQVNVVSANEYYVTTHEEVVIYKENKAYLANYSTTLDKDEKIDKFSCVIEGVNGGFKKKFKAGDLSRSQYSESLATDAESVYLGVDIPTYPIVVTTDVTIHHTNNTLVYPSFVPVYSYDVAVTDALYEITFPSALAIRYLTTGEPIKPTVAEAAGKTKWTFSVKDVAPLVKEKYDGGLSKLVPKVFFIPESVDYYGNKGSLKTWEEFGKWVGALCEGRGELPAAAIEKVHALTDTCTSDWSKVAVLYDFLKQTTRYVSIQLGIGGFRPLPAEYVWRTGFGDCKALTNYMQALLKEAGVQSTYTLISTEQDKLLSLPNFQQLNHVILKVPTSKQVIWMECTNPEIPLGYTHDDIAGHDALEVTPQGGKLVSLKDYPDSVNLVTTRVELKLQPDGTASVAIVDSLYAHTYTNKYSWKNKNDRDRRDLASAAFDLPFGEITKCESCLIPFKTRVEAGVVPCTATSVEAAGVKITSGTGARMFVTINPLHKHFKEDNLAKDRKHELCIGRGGKTIEEITLSLPAGVELESLPRSVSVSNEVGSFTSSITEKDGVVRVTNKLMMNRGTYATEKTALMDAIRSAQRTAYKSKVVLRRK